MKRLALILSLFSLGCDGLAQSSDVFSVSDDFSDAQLVEMQVIADDLCTVSRGRHCYEMTRESAPNQIETSDMAGEPDTVLATTYWSAVTPVRARTFRIEIRDPADSRFALTFRHELGHVAGCHRELGPGNVMSAWAADTSESWTEADLACID